MEIIHELECKRPELKAVLFDFDGTISTLRRGWEGIMEPLMIEMISGPVPVDEKLLKEVREYIDQSTGIQTIFQMQWLCEAVKRFGRNPSAPEDPWWYKREYNRRLMEPVRQRMDSIRRGERQPGDFLIKGSLEFLEALKSRGVEIYVASGTDDPDVKKEAGILGVSGYFREIAGAPPGKADCSKEAVLRMLLEQKGLKGPELAVIGDGRVEIALGREFEAITLGVASDEEKLCGINPVKRERLVKAGAHAITGDFLETDEIINWLF
jgi:phosphoglycolate phosphatase-like HAD superfamily hydrolase